MDAFQLDEATKEASRSHTEPCMREQQTALLQSASNNALKMVDTKLNETQSEMRDVIDEEVAGYLTTTSTKTTMSFANKRTISGTESRRERKQPDEGKGTDS